jgi:hypothetical protein
LECMAGFVGIRTQGSEQKVHIRRNRLHLNAPSQRRLSVEEMSSAHWTRTASLLACGCPRRRPLPGNIRPQRTIPRMSETAAGNGVTLAAARYLDNHPEVRDLGGRGFDWRERRAGPPTAESIRRNGTIR